MRATSLPRPLLAIAVLVLIGCAGAPVKLLTSDGPVYHRPPNSSNLPIVGCTLNSASGPLIVDATYGTAIVDGLIGTRPVMWPAGYTGRQAGSEVEVVDPDGNLVARTGGSYAIFGAQPKDKNGAFVACGTPIEQ